MPRRSAGSIILVTLAAAALAQPAAAQGSASARIGVRAVIAPLVTGLTASELAEPSARFVTERTRARESHASAGAPGTSVPAPGAVGEGPASSEPAEAQRYRAVVRLDGVDGSLGAPLRVRDVRGYTRDLARESAVLVSDAPAVEVRRALARLLASAARRSPHAARPATNDDRRADAPASSTIRLTLELTPSTMLTQ